MKQAYLMLILVLNLLYGSSQDLVMDSAIIATDSATINGEKYWAIYGTNEGLYILDSKDNIVFAGKDYYPDFEFIDFDNDGYKDLMINYLSNVPAIKDLIKYDIKSKVFKPIEDFSKYPDPKPIPGSKYFYSYHRSGCADMNWDSDLFYIENFNTIKVGNIAGRECEDMEEKDGIYIYKISGEKAVIIETLPIEIIHNYNDNKWGFIFDYWHKNFKEFE